MKLQYHRERFKYSGVLQTDMRPSAKVAGRIEELAGEFETAKETNERGEEIYKLAQESGLVAGRNAIEVATACYLLATYESNTPIPYKLIEKNFEVDNLMGNYRCLLKELGLKIMPPNAIEVLPYVADRFEIPERRVELMGELLSAYDKNAGAAVLLASANYACQFKLKDQFHKYSQKKYARRYHVSEISIRNHYKDMLKLYVEDG